MPVNTLAPAITGDPYIGETLTATPGAWTGADTVSGEWYVNNVATGDTDTSYTVLLADAGKSVEYRETATNTTGSVTQASNTISIGSLTAHVQALFSNGEQGGMWDATDMASLFQDSAGTTPVTAYTQPIGRMLDISGNGHHHLQSAASSRPQYTADGALFDGIDDGMLSDSIDLSAETAITFAALYEAKTLASHPPYGPILNHGAGGLPWQGDGAVGIYQRTSATEIVALTSFAALGGKEVAHEIFPAVLTPVAAVWTVVLGAPSAAQTMFGLLNGAPAVAYQGINVLGPFLDAPIVTGRDALGWGYAGNFALKRGLIVGGDVGEAHRALIAAWLAEVQ